MAFRVLLASINRVRNAIEPYDYRDFSFTVSDTIVNTPNSIVLYCTFISLPVFLLLFAIILSLEHILKLNAILCAVLVDVMKVESSIYV